MEPFEEFQFKPITEGLGFHKKNNPDGSNKQDHASIDSDFNLLDEGPRSQFSSPLPRPSDNYNDKTNIGHTNKTQTEISGKNKTKDISAPANAVDDILQTLKKNRALDFDDQKLKQKSPAHVAPSTQRISTADEYIYAQFNMTAAVLDGMLVVAASLICTIILLLVTKVDLIANLMNPDRYFMVYFSTYLMIAMVSIVYFVVNRVFMGFTPGEWAFDMRIGKPNEQGDTTYMASVLIRSLVIAFTGFIVLPIASIVSGKDYAGMISMARLYQRK